MNKQTKLEKKKKQPTNKQIKLEIEEKNKIKGRGIRANKQR